MILKIKLTSIGEVAVKVQAGLKMLGGRAAVLGAGRLAVVWPIKVHLLVMQKIESSMLSHLKAAERSKKHQVEKGW